MYGASTPPATSTQSTISIDTVLSKVAERSASIKDISGTIDLEQMSADNTVIKGQATMQARLPNLLRLKFTKPDAFAGSIYVIDRKANQVMQYSPITEQVLITGIDQVISERYVPTTVEQLFSLPSPDDYDLTIINVDNKSNERLVTISARAKKGSDAPFFHFWIDQQQWLVSRMKVFDSAGKLLFTIALRDVRTNQNLTDAVVKKMPPGALPVYR